MEGRSSLLLFLVITFLNGCESTYNLKHISLSSYLLSKDYTLYPDVEAAYKIYKDEMTWEEARNRCISDGGDLAIPDTIEEVKFFARLDFNSMDRLFIGIQKTPDVDEWIRIDNGLPVTWVTKFNTFFVTGRTGCVAIVTHRNWLLMNVPCRWKIQSICEIKLPTNESINMTEKPDETTTQVLQSTVLPEDYSIYPGDNIAYKMYKDKMTWAEARYRCFSDGGDLAIADIPERIKRIEMLGSDIEDLMFVGFHKPTGSEEWFRIDNGLPVKSLPWSHTRFNLPSFDCAAITYGYQLSEVPCKEKHQSVCEINLATYDVAGTKVKLIETTTQIFRSSYLPKDYSIYPNDNVAYKIYKNEAKWGEARNRCISDGGDLAIADTKEKIQFMSNMDSNKNYLYFVGFYRPTGSQKWIRVDNNSSITSLPWLMTPAFDSGSDCAIIAANESPTLMDFHCDWRLKYFCEIRIIEDNYSSKINNSLTIKNGQECTKKNILYLFIILYYIPQIFFFFRG